MLECIAFNLASSCRTGQKPNHMWRYSTSRMTGSSHMMWDRSLTHLFPSPKWQVFPTPDTHPIWYPTTFCCLPLIKNPPLPSMWFRLLSPHFFTWFWFKFSSRACNEAIWSGISFIALWDKSSRSRWGSEHTDAGNSARLLPLFQNKEIVKERRFSYKKITVPSLNDLKILINIFVVHCSIKVSISILTMGTEI